MTTTAQRALADRIRNLLDPEDTIREISMFGGLALMVNDEMLVSVGKDGSLLVRVEAQQHDRLLQEPGASQAEMGKGRTMGPGWITVAADQLSSDDSLSEWVTAAKRRSASISRARPEKGS
ncbi:MULTISPECIES: TfoX/Sxy family protein [Kocuria]|uniref:TfoX/Sxy family protein n=1 Tax=Kocuria subflava TaxID=1736139 RepID=A0A846TY47_9MICC|nr:MULTISPECIES: TfoX/Sxy family protein [Kocuria]NKE10672.1 TfoX/Sxy family protein [Kocuria subflava]